MIMKKRVLIPALIIGTLLTGSLALAGPGFGGGNCGGGNCGGYSDGGCNGKRAGKGAMSFEQHEERVERRLQMMSAVLELTEDQQAQIEGLLNQRWQDNQQRREEMQASREAMRELRSADTFNESEFRTAIAKHNELKTEMMVDRAKMQQELYALLTPEQQEKAETLRGVMGGKGKGRHGGRGFGF
jgi:protein CpxP